MGNRNAEHLPAADKVEGIGQVGNRPPLAQNQGQAAADGHGTECNDEGGHLAFGNHQAVEAADQEARPERQHQRDDQRVGVRMGKHGRHHTRDGHHGTQRQVNAARNDHKRNTKSQQGIDGYLRDDDGEVGDRQKAGGTQCQGYADDHKGQQDAVHTDTLHTFFVGVSGFCVEGSKRFFHEKQVLKRQG